MKRIKSLICSILCVSMLSGCATGGPNQTGGSLLGGATGALIGTQFGKGHGRLAAVGIGTMLGAMVGGSIGKSMDDRDRALAAKTAQNVLEYQPDNTKRSWKNPNNKHRGNFVVHKTKELRDRNLVCRDYTHTVVIDGETEVMHGRACRDIRDSRANWKMAQ